MSKNLYLCTHCRAKIPKIEKALYVDQSTNRPFCSEKCIMEFHAPYMESFEREELEERQALGLTSESELDELYHRHDLFQKALNGPDEVWFRRNPLGEEYHTHIARLKEGGESLFYILVCSYFDDAPSFVYFKCLTKSQDLADFYKDGEPKNFSGIAPTLDIPAAEAEVEGAADKGEKQDPVAEVEIPQQALEDLELKKSEYLAGLLETRQDEDIPFEDFTRYDEFLPLTIDDPDEIFAKEDDDGDHVRTYIKSFQAFGEAFFYVVVCMKVSIKQPEDHEALLPVISFPSTDQDLYKNFAVGERISSMLKN